MKYLVLALSLLFSVSAFAQAEQAQTEPAKKSRKKRTEQGSEAPARTMKPSRNKLAESYPDSVEFNKAFADLYTILKSEETIQQKADKAFKQISRTFSRTGVDSAVAYKAVMAKIDPNMEREIIFRSYRTQMTAEELKDWVAFLRTPTGKKILAVGEKLIGAHDKQVDAQVRRAVNTAVTPLRKAKAAEQREGMRPAVSNESEVPPPPPPPPAHLEDED